MRWQVTLSGNRQDIEWLVAEGLKSLSPVEGASSDLLLEVEDPEGDDDASNRGDAGRAAIEAEVRRINGFGRLRWGRRYEGVAPRKIETIDANGKSTQYVFVDPIPVHMAHDEYADMIERMGHSRPPKPQGLDAISALGGEAVTALAANNPDVARVLDLVERMLVGDFEIDWGAGYSALETIDEDLHSRGLKGHALGWWTRKEHDNFTATANSVEVLGARARHGKRYGLTSARMSDQEASWFIRRAAALWVTHLLDGAASSAGT